MTKPLTRSEYDVVVIGGGPIGLSYAGWVKKKRPHTSVVVLEAATEPNFKIGESTLSATIRNMIDQGFTYPMLRRLFHIKTGLGYWWTGPETDELHEHIDVLGLDETFQFERRAFEIAFLELTRRKGIEVLEGAKVLMGQSDLESDCKKIVFSHDGQEHALHAKIICDATGPARVVSKHLGIGNIELDDFNTNSYWAHFRWKQNKQHTAMWEIPVTRHICFEDGWLWFIDIDSWESTPTANLESMVHHLLDIDSEDDAAYPSRQELKQTFGGDTERVMSIGFVVRDDMAEKMTAEEGFRYYVDKYPAIKKVLEDFELIEAKYQGKSYHKRTRIARRAEKVAGPGWLSVGESAYLVDAFFSTGMNFGVGAAYMGAKHTVRALDDGTFHTERAFSRYQRYVETIFDTLYREIGMYYRAFRNRETFENIMRMRIAWGLPDIAHKVGYTEEDPYVWNIMHPYYQDTLDEVLRTFKRAEARGERLEAFLPAIEKASSELCQILTQHPRFQYVKWGKYFNDYNHSLERDDTWVRPMGDFEVQVCRSCDTWHVANEINRCPNCGQSVPGLVAPVATRKISEAATPREPTRDMPSDEMPALRRPA